jgi:hypothetical protein
MTLSRMTTTQMTLRRMIASKMTLSQMTLSTVTLSKMTLSKMTLSKMTLSKMTLSKMTLSQTTQNQMTPNRMTVVEWHLTEQTYKIDIKQNDNLQCHSAKYVGTVYYFTTVQGVLAPLNVLLLSVILWNVVTPTIYLGMIVCLRWRLQTELFCSLHTWGAPVYVAPSWQPPLPVVS